MGGLDRMRAVSPAAAVAVGYGAALAVAELALVQGGLLAGAACHAVLLIVLLAHHLVAPVTAYHSLLVGLALLPIVRLVSLTVPILGIPYLAWHVMVAIPIAVAAGLAIRSEQIEPRLMGLGARFDAVFQLAVAAVGIPLGLLAWLALRPRPVISGVDPVQVVLAGIVGVLFIAVVEEVVFRGVLQGVALRALGSSVGAVSVSAFAYASMSIPSGSPGFVLVMLGAAALFGWIVEVTGSLGGVIGAHALLAVGMLVVWPAILGGL
ncbi:MAG TPA: CPBP family intramembrane glutamic endopeptidase [Candidatus Limnocylindria bacterium]